MKCVPKGMAWQSGMSSVRKVKESTNRLAAARRAFAAGECDDGEKQARDQWVRPGIRLRRLQPPGGPAGDEVTKIGDRVDRLGRQPVVRPLAIDIDGTAELRCEISDQRRAGERHRTS